MGKVVTSAIKTVRGRGKINKRSTATAVVPKLAVVPLPKEVMERDDVIRFAGSGAAVKKKQLRGKRAKRLERHENWLKKINVSQLCQKSLEEAKRRRRTPVVGDMRALADALPELSMRPLAMEELGGGRGGGEGGRGREFKSSDGTLKQPKHRHNNMLRDLDHYGQVLAHPAFKKDPLGAISQHVKNSVAMGKT